jgi:hypothetical protein
MEVFSVQTLKARDFCRLFVKAGLLSHISQAFERIYLLLRAAPMCPPPPSSIGKKAGSSNNISKISSKEIQKVNGLEIKKSDSSDNSNAWQGNRHVHCHQECKYLHCIADIFLKFSKVDAIVAIDMARNKGVIQSILNVLKDPRLISSAWNTLGKAAASVDAATTLWALRTPE